MDGKLSIFRNLLKRPCDENSEITKLLGEKQGRPLLIGEKLDAQIKAFLTWECSHGEHGNSQATAKGIVLYFV